MTSKSDLILARWSDRFPSNAYAAPGSPKDWAIEAAKALDVAPGPDDLHYLKSIYRQLQELKEALGGRHPSIGSEVLADNLDWLNCFIDKHGGTTD